MHCRMFTASLIGTSEMPVAVPHLSRHHNQTCHQIFPSAPWGGEKQKYPVIEDHCLNTVVTLTAGSCARPPHVTLHPNTEPRSWRHTEVCSINLRQIKHAEIHHYRTGCVLQLILLLEALLPGNRMAGGRDGENTIYSGLSVCRALCTQGSLCAVHCAE